MLKTFDGQRTLLNMLKTYDYDEGAIESWNPLALAAKDSRDHQQEVFQGMQQWRRAMSLVLNTKLTRLVVLKSP